MPPEAPKEVVDQMRAEFGFDKPLYVQYLRLARPHRCAATSASRSSPAGRSPAELLERARQHPRAGRRRPRCSASRSARVLGTLAAFNHGTCARQAVLGRRDHRASACRTTGSASCWSSSSPSLLDACPPQGMGAAAASRRSWEQVQAPGPAGHHAVADPDGRHQPAGARDRARDPQPGVRRRAARQGPARAGACVITC